MKCDDKRFKNSAPESFSWLTLLFTFVCKLLPAVCNLLLSAVIFIGRGVYHTQVPEAFSWIRYIARYKQDLLH